MQLGLLDLCKAEKVVVISVVLEVLHLLEICEV